MKRARTLRGKMRSRIDREQVGRTPDAVASSSRTSSSTYRELNRRAEILAADFAAWALDRRCRWVVRGTAHPR